MSARGAVKRVRGPGFRPDRRASAGFTPEERTPRGSALPRFLAVRADNLLKPFNINPVRDMLDEHIDSSAFLLRFIKLSWRAR